jgi:hypothetical protein
MPFVGGSPSVQAQAPLQGSREMRLQSANRGSDVPVAAGFDYQLVLAKRPESQRRRHLPVEPQQSQVVANSSVTRLDEGVVETRHDGAVQEFFQLFQDADVVSRQPVTFNVRFRCSVTFSDFPGFILCSGLCVDRDRSSFNDATELERRSS